MLDNLNLSYLATFRSVVELGSFSAAAERVGLSQPAVSLQMRQLERQLGTRIIERLGRRAMPTAAGAELLAHIGSIEAAVSDMRDGMARFANGTVGRLRFGTGATACTYLLPPILRKLRKRFPEVEIVVTTGNTFDIAKAVEENRLDGGLVTLPATGRTLEVSPVLRDEFVAIALRDFSLPPRITPSSLADLPVLLFEPGGNTRRIADQWFARARTTLKPIMSLGSVEAIKALVGASLGCAIVPAMAIQLPTRLLKRSLSPRLYRRLAVIVRRDKPQHRVLKELIAHIKQLANQAQSSLVRDE
jgi:DNA-binding transcriptional LysR family regulator